MDRGERRYQSLRVKARRLFLLDCEMREWGRMYLWQAPWRALENLGDWRMNSCPKRYRKWKMIRPARSAQNQILRSRLDLESASFPDYRKPHIYYW